MKSRIERCDSKLKALFEATSADISAALYNVATGKVIGPYVEDPEIFRISIESSMTRAYSLSMI
jgi:hypothetical protein